MTLRHTVEALEKAVSAERMDSIVRRLANYERYHASRGFRDAADICCAYLKSEGIEAGIHAYPSGNGETYGTGMSYGPKEWVCRDAWCELATDGYRRIADYRGNTSSIFEACGPCAEPIETEVVLLEKGTDEAAYPDVDLTGRMVYAPAASAWDLAWTHKKRGALGVIQDRAVSNREHGVIPSGDTDYDNVRPWAGWEKNGERQPLGFCLTPFEGRALAAHIRDRQEQGEKAVVRVFADTELKPGAFEVVVGRLPGETDEELLITAHLCHPRGEANDNLSGVSGAMEVLRVLKHLTERGTLAPLKRGVRVILVPECLGSCAYLDEIGEGRKKLLAGINLDMIGASQNGNYEPIGINEPPYSCRSFVTGLLSALLKEVSRDACITSKYGYVPLFNALIMEYNGASDHAIWTDPAVGVPMPMIGQAPDRYIHTDKDLPETLDPFIHAKCTTLAAAYVYTLANLSAADVKLIMNEQAERFVNRLNHVAEQALGGDITEDDFARYVHLIYLDFYVGACDDFLRFFPEQGGEEAAAVRAMVEDEKARLREIAALAASGVGDGFPERPAPKFTGGLYDGIPKRGFLGTMDDVFFNTPGALAKIDELDNMFSGSLYAKTGYLIDGVRTLGEVVEQAFYGNHQDSTPESIRDFVLLMKEEGFVTFQEFT
ncbi:MAG: DUF4910 domain-containing protein [Clostridiales Family XIII bacterium]|jgi:hypothetical protein|nr:DUF4910 domain-containing protein [Clostridiales Family XIII bacterium]